MFRKNKILLSCTLLLSMSAAAQAAPPEKLVVVAPQCLLQNLQTNYKVLSSTDALVLLETSNAGLDALIEAKNHRSLTPCGGFMEVTDAYNARGTRAAKSFLADYAHPASNKTQAAYSIKYPNQVTSLLQTITPQEIWTNLTQFSNTSRDQFPDRYAGSDNGVKAAQWLQSKIEAMAKANNRTDITVYTVATGVRYKQPSVVVKIGNSNEPGVVIGSHMDTLASTAKDLKPGADDDGSGSMTAMETARVLISSDMRFKKPIYFIWYAAEEMGLVGSAQVVKDFKAKNIAVDAVLQLDMTGYANQNDPTIWLITDNANKALTDYLETLINTYVKTPVGRTKCGYSCSDHASWDKAGFNAAFPFEAEFGKDDPYIHTSKDTMDVLSLSHMTDFAKLGTAFAVELAEPVGE